MEPAATPTEASVEAAEARTLSANELEELVEAATDAIRNDGGFGWLRPPAHDVMRLYWRGVLLIPEARLFIAKLDGAVCGSVQLWFRPSNNQAQRLIGEITTFFVASWARGRGIGAQLLEEAEACAMDSGLFALELSLRETQERARRTFAQRGYQNWGVNPHYARLGGDWVAGHHFVLTLDGSDKNKSETDKSGKENPATDKSETDKKA